MDSTRKGLANEKEQENQNDIKEEETIDIHENLPKEEVIETEEKKIDNNLMFEKKAYLFSNYIFILVAH